MIVKQADIPAPTTPEMQVLENQQHVDRRHGVPTFAPYGVDDPPFYQVNAPDFSLWRPADHDWPLDTFVTGHHAVNHCVYSDRVCVQQQPPPPGIRPNSNHCYQAANFNVPFAEWPSDPDLGTDCSKYNNPTAPSIATLYPPMPQNDLVAWPENLGLPQEMEWNSLSPVSPTTPKESPTSQKKRNRNRLAAAKCRKKAKRGVDELQQRERDLLRENKMLSAQAGLLREEVLQLKAEILRHNECDNDFISQYIQKAAKQVGVTPVDDNTCYTPKDRPPVPVKLTGGP
ncbi:hypothetical protein GGR55DRAFT_290600 [Xylaria sp. FL0064]|nr:hypothetical protein GGR55DRAFT_290600 [Xylaria sp. FL0064]